MGGSYFHFLSYEGRQEGGGEMRQKRDQNEREGTSLHTSNAPLFAQLLEALFTY